MASYFLRIILVFLAVSSSRVLMAARAHEKRIVLHYRSGEAEDHLARWGMLVHPLLRLMNEIVVPSEYLQSVFAHHGYQVRMIRNVVDTTRFRYRDRRPLRPQLLSTRNLEPYYRVDNTIEAFVLLKTHYPEATLTIAGIWQRGRPAPPACCLARNWRGSVHGQDGAFVNALSSMMRPEFSSTPRSSIISQCRS